MTNKKVRITTLIGMLEDEMWTIEYHRSKLSEATLKGDITYHETMITMNERFKEMIKDEIANLID